VHTGCIKSIQPIHKAGLKLEIVNLGVKYVWMSEGIGKVMLHFKSCPKCTTGTIEQNFDAHGNYLQCLNCGFMRDVPEDLSKRNVKAMLTAWRKELHTPELESADAVA
jgi:ribosomal protein S27AE